MADHQWLAQPPEPAGERATAAGRLDRQQLRHVQVARRVRGVARQRPAAVALRLARGGEAAIISLSADIHPSVLNNSYDRMYL